ncbi:MAG TPA: quercetin 2,3-dioxygenase [Planctomycetaceae bacterium]|nr:quercetin 2,3-dioxygenase [Planctomycetaceae bacterium]HRE99776.1 pirin family protein [Pirellulaceae bacterium]
MRQVRRATERGHFDHGWLKTWHTFSFADYHDPRHVRFRTLRVMNEDFVAPGRGFGTHPHRDMEIVTYVLSGALEHRDSMGNGEVLRPGEFQRMTAGSGITHSEFNPSADEPTHLYQIWLLPEARGLEPSYEQKRFPEEERRDRLRLVASPDAADGSLAIRQDARIWLATLGPDKSVTHRLAPGRHAWLQVLRGSVRSGDLELAAGDGLAVSDESDLEVIGTTESEILLFDLD